MKNLRPEKEAVASMSLRNKSKILGVSPTYLSLLVNGKRPWRGNLKERYQELVNTSVNTPEATSQLVRRPCGHSNDLPLSRPLPARSGAEGETRTRTPPKGQRILSPRRLPFRHLGFN